MIVTCVHVKVRPEEIAGFIEATTVNHNESVKEPGNLRFDVLQQADDPCRFMIYEVYQSETAILAHKNTNHYLRWRDSVQEMMAEPRKGIKYKILQPEEKTKW